MQDTKPIITMEAKLAFLVNGVSHKDLKEREDIGISVGGFTFTVKNPKTNAPTIITFDFDAFGMNFKPDALEYSSGQGCAFDDYHINDDFIDEYERCGLSINDITAKLLASTVRINDFEMQITTDRDYYPDSGDFDSFELQMIVFSDGEQDYPVSEEVITEFNNYIKRIFARN